MLLQQPIIYIMLGVYVNNSLPEPVVLVRIQVCILDTHQTIHIDAEEHPKQ